MSSEQYSVHIGQSSGLYLGPGRVDDLKRSVVVVMRPPLSEAAFGAIAAAAPGKLKGAR